MAVKGLDRLKRQIAALPKIQIEAVVRSLEQNARELANAIARAAPADTGDLAASIGFAPLGLAPKTAATQAFRASNTLRGEVLGKNGLGYEVFAGDDVAFYARWVEFGTAASAARPPTRDRNYRRTLVMTRAYAVHHATPAQPYFFPTLRAHKKSMKSRVVRNANKAAKAAAGVR